ncbi:MAG: ARMT1-like domain-containing protein [Methanocellales archaeon]|nr:ARMT1-like domain-containing protein [Methanocellales archaeon]MDD3291247.1 ARMT1-like domain-containing protein [Methanocellales archaeon]MDD5235419.1 ARMT1-like domain-containing protein [Methanocellales archaeon]MDD5484498.1 ARMT1-like domain-containing protein [Methanocellales archaeon]
MKLYLDCIPCLMRQALEAARFVTNDEKAQKKILKKVLIELDGINWDTSPLEIAHVVHRIVRKESGVDDPYNVVKRQYNDIALKMYPNLKGMVDRSPTPLLTALRLAIAGNIIDYGVGSNFDLDKAILGVLEKEFKIYDLSEFMLILKTAKNLAYLADNAGEIVFDKILIETILGEHDLDKILFVIKDEPIINDATEEDAIYVGIDEIQCIEFLKVGVGVPGKGMNYSSKEFWKILAQSDMVIGKGQGNYEALSGHGKIFFLLTAKCPVIAKDLGVAIGDTILKLSDGLK